MDRKPEEDEPNPYAGYVPLWVNLLGMTDIERKKAVADLWSRGSGDGKSGLDLLVKDLK